MRHDRKWLLSQKWIVIAAALGFILIFIGSFATRQTDESENLDVRLQAYTKQLEEKIEEMLDELHGVSDVHVLLTLEGSSAYIYATDQGNAGNKDYVIIDQGDTQKPVLLQEVLSDIRGISVVCKNGDDPEIKRKIIGVLCTGFGVPSNRVYVAGS